MCKKGRNKHYHKCLKHESATCIFITKLIEIKLDYKNGRGKKKKKGFMEFPSMSIPKSCVSYQHGSDYIKKVSLLGTGPNPLCLGHGNGGLLENQFRLNKRRVQLLFFQSLCEH